MGKKHEEAIWLKLKSFGFNDFAVAGIMGNLKAESNLEPTNLQNIYNTYLGMSDEEYTRKVDTQEYLAFVTDQAGYGLAQWTFWSRKAQLLLFCRNKKVSIGDMDAQLEFLYKEISESYPSLFKELKSCKSVDVASDLMLTKYERPADMGTKVITLRRKYSQDFYQKYSGKITDENRIFELGSIVEICNCKESISSYGSAPLIEVKGGYACVTKYAPNGKHPYHLIHTKGSASKVYGWVTANSIIKTIKTVDDLAREVIEGKWGNGIARKEALTNYGLDYKIIQARVNEMMKKGE